MLEHFGGQDLMAMDDRLFVTDYLKDGIQDDGVRIMMRPSLDRGGEEMEVLR